MDLKGLIQKTSDERHIDLLRMAYMRAWLDSKDDSTKTGAIIINEKTGELLAWGDNHFPDGLDLSSEQQTDRQFKLENIIPAELAAIFYAAKKGKALQGTTMYMPGIPYYEAAVAMVAVGMKKFVGHEAMINKTPEDLGEKKHRGLVHLKNNDVKAYMYTGEVGGVEAFIRGEYWRP